MRPFMEIQLFPDGTDKRGRTMWCAVYGDFLNLAESPNEWHCKPWVAVRRLLKRHPRHD